MIRADQRCSMSIDAGFPEWAPCVPNDKEGLVVHRDLEVDSIWFIAENIDSSAGKFPRPCERTRIVCLHHCGRPQCRPVHRRQAIERSVAACRDDDLIYQAETLEAVIQFIDEHVLPV